MRRREFIAGLGSAGGFDRLQRTRSRALAYVLSIEILSLKAGPNEISGLLPYADEWLTMAPRLLPLRPLCPWGPRADGTRR